MVEAAGGALAGTSSPHPDSWVVAFVPPEAVDDDGCGGELARALELLRRRKQNFAVLTGEDAQCHEALSDGADGGAGGCLHGGDLAGAGAHSYSTGNATGGLE